MFVYERYVTDVMKERILLPLPEMQVFEIRVAHSSTFNKKRREKNGEKKSIYISGRRILRSCRT